MVTFFLNLSAPSKGRGTHLRNPARVDRLPSNGEPYHQICLPLSELIVTLRNDVKWKIFWSAKLWDREDE